MGCPGGLYVLRLGHRPRRDKRITTHCGLVALALGARGIIISGGHDEAVVDSIRDVADRWHVDFSADLAGSWEDVVREFKDRGCLVVHLTMYGVNLPFVLDGLKNAFRKRGILAIIGSGKVPAAVFEMSDLNVAITHLPHSEVAALAIFADRLFGGVELLSSRSRGLIILPQHRGKAVLHRISQRSSI